MLENFFKKAGEVMGFKELTQEEQEIKDLEKEIKFKRRDLKLEEDELHRLRNSCLYGPEAQFEETPRVFSIERMYGELAALETKLKEKKQNLPSASV